MIKFSIIVPVYNVEKYIDKCLKSIHNQTYKNYEVIVVNDGTKDSSQDIIDKYVKLDKKFKSFIKPNGGLSDARNFGLNKASADYVIFVDSDDYINKKLLSVLNKEITKNNNPDLLKFQVTSVGETGKIIKKYLGKNIDLSTGKEAFAHIINEELFEPVWMYAYNYNFWKKNNFEFAKNKLHEDFGLTPYVLIKAASFVEIPYYGYNYLIRENSIITNKNISNLTRKANDMLYHFDNLMYLINKEDISKNISKLFKSFITNSIINKAKELDKANLNKYIAELKKRKIEKYLLDDSLIRKLKKSLIKINIKIYIKLFLKKEKS